MPPRNKPRLRLPRRSFRAGCKQQAYICSAFPLSSRSPDVNRVRRVEPDLCVNSHPEHEEHAPPVHLFEPIRIEGAVHLRGIIAADGPDVRYPCWRPSCGQNQLIRCGATSPPSYQGCSSVGDHRMVPLISPTLRPVYRVISSVPSFV